VFKKGESIEDFDSSLINVVEIQSGYKAHYRITKKEDKIKNTPLIPAKPFAVGGETTVETVSTTATLT
jgi:hypothetical protein